MKIKQKTEDIKNLSKLREFMTEHKTKNFFKQPKNTSCAPGAKAATMLTASAAWHVLSIWPAGVPLAQTGGNCWGLDASFPLVTSKDLLCTGSLRTKQCKGSGQD